jgi:hypothetical protein
MMSRSTALPSHLFVLLLPCFFEQCYRLTSWPSDVIQAVFSSLWQRGLCPAAQSQNVASLDIFSLHFFPLSFSLPLSVVS